MEVFGYFAITNALSSVVFVVGAPKISMDELEGITGGKEEMFDCFDWLPGGWRREVHSVGGAFLRAFYFMFELDEKSVSCEFAC